MAACPTLALEHCACCVLAVSRPTSELPLCCSYFQCTNASTSDTHWLCTGSNSRANMTGSPAGQATKPRMCRPNWNAARHHGATYARLRGTSAKTTHRARAFPLCTTKRATSCATCRRLGCQFRSGSFARRGKGGPESLTDSPLGDARRGRA